MKQEIVDFFRKCRYKAKERIKWNKDYFFLKHSMNYHRNKRIIFSVSKFVALLGSLIYILISSKIILFTEKHTPYFNVDFYTDYISKNGVLGTQITLTLICVSLIALISNIENKYVYGERILDLAFPSKILSFKVILLALFASLLTNICLMLNNYPFVYSVSVLLLTVYLAIFILYRFATVFLSRGSLRKELFYKYYKSNLTHMKKARPIEPHVSEPLRKLKVVTLKHISNKNYPELNEYMLLYFNLLKVTLFNKPKQVQEYYTEHTNFQDIIGHINEFALAMLHEGKALYGLQIYNSLLRHINYYKIVCVQEIAFTSESFLEAFSDLKDIIQIKRYLSELLYMSKMLLQQTYLYSTVDLSYCRLAKPKNMIYYFAKRGMYEKIYDLIIHSDKLSDIEKSELIESVRMRIIDLTSSSLEQDIEDFRQKERFHKKDRIYGLDIKGEPISLLFIRFIEQNDIKHFVYYSYAWNNPDKKDRSVSFALILTMLSVLNNLHHKGKREYLYDINIEPKAVRQLFKKCELLNIKVDDQTLNDFYSFITENYIVDKKETEERKRLYSFHPKLSFDQNVVDMLFAYLYWKNQKEHTLQEIATEHNLIYRKGIEKIILNLCPENAEKIKKINADYQYREKKNKK